MVKNSKNAILLSKNLKMTIQRKSVFQESLYLLKVYCIDFFATSFFGTNLINIQNRYYAFCSKKFFVVKQISRQMCNLKKWWKEEHFSTHNGHTLLPWSWEKFQRKTRHNEIIKGLKRRRRIRRGWWPSLRQVHLNSIRYIFLIITLSEI